VCMLWECCVCGVRVCGHLSLRYTHDSQTVRIWRKISDFPPKSLPFEWFLVKQIRRITLQTRPTSPDTMTSDTIRHRGIRRIKTQSSDTSNTSDIRHRRHSHQTQLSDTVQSSDTRHHSDTIPDTSGTSDTIVIKTCQTHQTLSSDPRHTRHIGHIGHISHIKHIRSKIRDTSSTPETNHHTHLTPSILIRHTSSDTVIRHSHHHTLSSDKTSSDLFVKIQTVTNLDSLHRHHHIHLHHIHLLNHNDLHNYNKTKTKTKTKQKKMFIAFRKEKPWKPKRYSGHSTVKTRKKTFSKSTIKTNSSEVHSLPQFREQADSTQQHTHTHTHTHTNTRDTHTTHKT